MLVPQSTAYAHVNSVPNNVELKPFCEQHTELSIQSIRVLTTAPARQTWFCGCYNVCKGFTSFLLKIFAMVFYFADKYLYSCDRVWLSLLLSKLDIRAVQI